MDAKGSKGQFECGFSLAASRAAAALSTSCGVTTTLVGDRIRQLADAFGFNFHYIAGFEPDRWIKARTSAGWSAVQTIMSPGTSVVKVEM